MNIDRNKKYKDCLKLMKNMSDHLTLMLETDAHRGLEPLEMIEDVVKIMRQEGDHKQILELNK